MRMKDAVALLGRRRRILAMNRPKLGAPEISAMDAMVTRTSVGSIAGTVITLRATHEPRNGEESAALYGEAKNVQQSCDLRSKHQLRQ